MPLIVVGAKISGVATQDELLRMLDEHVLYEWGAVIEMANRIPLAQETEWQNATLECFLLHARVLLDFFYAKPAGSRRPTDVFAFQYVEGGEERWSVLSPRDGAPAIFGHEVNDLYNKISTSIGHLSTARLSKAAWNYLALRDGITVLLARWTRHLNKDARSTLIGWEKRTGARLRASTADLL